MLNTPFSVWPSYTPEEIEAVASVLLSSRVNYWTGTECREFEREFAEFAGTRFAVALSNGTVALELALRVLGIGTGDEVIVTPRTFLASASCVVLSGARPVFADVDVESQNITADSIAAVLSPRTKAIICVHLAGWPCDMDPIISLARKHGIFVIEDCAQAHGARYKGRPVGGLGDIGAWSFCQDKIMTTGGEGGMLTLNDRTLWEKAWSFKDHGKSYDAMYNRVHPAGYRWVHESFGTNWRMIEIQAVIGRIQLRRMPSWNAARARNAARIASACNSTQLLSAPKFSCSLCRGECDRRTGCVHAFYKMYAFVSLDRLAEGWSRDRIIDEITCAGVPCFAGSCSEIYLEKAFEGTDYRPSERLPVAKRLGETSIMFLVHPTLSDSEINKTCEVIQEVAWRATR